LLALCVGLMLLRNDSPDRREAEAKSAKYDGVRYALWRVAKWADACAWRFKPNQKTCFNGHGTEGKANIPALNSPEVMPQT